jgi:MerR family transcriptional regulator/heat shock protein HspR
MDTEVEDLIDVDTPMISIGTAAQLLGVSVHTLRMYEREGLIIPVKKDSKHRLYSHGDINRVKCIRNAINKMKFSIESIKSIYSMIPCWTIINCSDEHRKTCKAYNIHGKPCWTYKHEDNPCAGKDCRECIVYRHYSDCNRIKEGIKYYTR